MTLDEDIRVALQDVVRPDGQLVAEPAAPLLLLREGRRRVRRRRVLTGSGAVAMVAAVAVIVGATGLINPSNSGSKPAPTLTQPAQSRQQRVLLGIDQSNQLVLMDLAHPAQKRSLKIPGLDAFTTNPTGGWIASYVPAGKKGATYVGLIDQAGHFTPTKQVLSQSDEVSDLAVSDDGSRLAYITGNVGSSPVTRIVVGPAPGHAGSTRAWTLQDRYINEIRGLSWAPDGRQLTFVPGIETGAGMAGNPVTLDTGAPGTSIPTTPAYDLGKCGASAATWLGASGRFAIVTECRSANEPPGPRLVDIDPQTGEVLGKGVLLQGLGCAATSLSASQDGNRVLVSECPGVSLVASGRRVAVPGNLLDAAWAGTGLPNPAAVTASFGGSCPAATFKLPSAGVVPGLSPTSAAYQTMGVGSTAVIVTGAKGQRVELLRGVSDIDFAVSAYSHGAEPLKQNVSVLGSTAVLYPASVTGDLGPRIPFATGSDLAANPCNRWEVLSIGLADQQLMDYAKGIKAVASPAVTSPTVASPAGVSPTVTSPAVAACAPASLTVRLGFEGSSMNRRGLVFLITNRMATTCQISGYPTLTLLDSAENPVTVKTTNGSGYIYQDPGPSRVLVPGSGHASFGVTVGVDMSGSCSAKSFMRVRLPGVHNSFNVPLDLPPCTVSGMDVTAIVSGSAGPPY